MSHTAEHQRLRDDAARKANWKRWGPYLSERQWGTVREDYSSDGNCWDYFPFEHAHLRAYRWGEDGLLGWTDRECRLCFAIALWNGKDPILKERLYGLTNSQGNHGEDVKERYWYLDSTPTHSYARAAYHYPRKQYPYQLLKDENARRGKDQPEFEIEDTGAFAEGFFDVVAEYAKAGDNDTCIRITVTNHSTESAELHLLPTLWFRNTWVWGCEHEGCSSKPWLWQEEAQPGVVHAQHETLHRFTWQCGPAPDGSPPELLFTENSTNTRTLYDDAHGPRHTKDAIGRYVIHGDKDAVNPKRDGTKAAAHYKLSLKPGESQTVLLRLREGEHSTSLDINDVEQVFRGRVAEADAFYATVLDEQLKDEQSRSVARQAYAGLLWTKQFYHYIVDVWLEGDPLMVKPPESRKHGRNSDWHQHFFARDVLSMPDKWEYPWFAAWDSCFHMIPLAEIDPDEAKSQLELFLREWYLHPNGQVPAYEFAFGDVNPPVHAWAVWRVYKMTAPRGQRDRRFLASCFQKLLLNFTWWVNRKDPHGNNVFGGGFLGLDNIGVFDRNQPLPGGGTLTQSDATAWMAFYCHTMLAMALELADPPEQGDSPEAAAYADMASKFFEHFVHIADAMNHMGGTGLWDDRDGFYYDHMMINGDSTPLRVQSLVGLLPMIAVETFQRGRIRKLKGFKKRLDWFLAHRHDLRRTITYMVTDDNAETPEGKVNDELFLLALPSRSRLEKMLTHLLNEDEFLSPFGIRSLSKKHEREPYELHIDGQRLCVRYTPAESETRMFGGNSNWRGPIWFPTNYLLLEALQRYHHFYGDSFKVECPTGSGTMLSLGEVAQELARRLSKLCPPDDAGRVLFYEYFHGDNGRGCGASHQTGWTALVTRCLRESVRDCRGFDV